MQACQQRLLAGYSKSPNITLLDFLLAPFIHQSFTLNADKETPKTTENDKK